MLLQLARAVLATGTVAVASEFMQTAQNTRSRASVDHRPQVWQRAVPLQKERLALL